MKTRRPSISPPRDAPDAADRPRFPPWFPTPYEAVSGFLFGGMLGLLVMSAIALDLDDYSRPAARPAKTSHTVAAATRAIVVTAPPSAARRVAVAEGITARRSSPAGRSPRHVAIIPANPF